MVSIDSRTWETDLLLLLIFFFFSILNGDFE